MARILENASEWELWGMRGESGGGDPTKWGGLDINGVEESWRTPWENPSLKASNQQISDFYK